MNLDFDATELRVLGCLIEKELTTPDQYPLSTNALVNACNQKSSRDPVMDLAERDVDNALLSLRERGLARSLRPSGSRAWKHRHVLPEVLPLPAGEVAVLTVLMLRGPQSPGELKTRTDRMHGFDDLGQVEAALQSLAGRSEPLTRNIGRSSGQSQDRWEHRLAAAQPVVRPAHALQFHALHESGIFTMPNPWDVGSALMMQELGFEALATTSSGFAGTLGKEDQEVTRDELVAHVAQLTSKLRIPLNVDSERLYPEESGGITETVRMLAEAGASGCSIEDYNPTTRTIDPINAAAEAVAEAAAACESHGLVLTARAENHLYGLGDLDDTIIRLNAYQAQGPHVLYAPGSADATEIGIIADSVELPVNVLARAHGPSIPELGELGVRRVSTGGALYGATMRTLRGAAQELLDPGTSTYVEQ
jgi:uncharacterized protein YceH (UPF0502 family)